MSHEVLKVAINHYKECLGELRQSAAYLNMKKWEKIILDEGGTLPLENNEKPKLKNIKPRVMAPTSKKDTGDTGKMAKIREYSADFIRKNGGSAHRGEIQKYLTFHGLSVTLKTLSVILSEAAEFTPVRGKGWSLK